MRQVHHRAWGSMKGATLLEIPYRGLVTVTDPQAIGNAQKSFPELDYVADTAEAITGAQAVLLLTEWREYRDLDPAATAELVSGKVLVDGRNVLTPELWRAAGWTYRALGRP